jgi:ankyrin repeat protein
MRRPSILFVALALLSWFATVPHCMGMQRPEPAVTPLVTGTSFPARSTALASDAPELELLQKGYVLIGSISAEWQLAPAETDLSGIPAPAVIAEFKQVLARAAAGSGGDLITLPEPKTSDFDSRNNPTNCHFVTTPGKETLITTYKKDGSFEQRLARGKDKTERVCDLRIGKRFYSLRASAAVWRLEPEIARQLIAGSEGNEAAIQAVEARGFTVPPGSLFKAIEAGDMPRVIELLNRGARLSALLPDGFPPGASYHRRTTPLHRAVWAKQIPVARLLLDRGADINARDNADETPLQYAVWDGPGYEREIAEIATFLLEHGANPNVYYKGSHETPLYRAIGSANVELVRVLLKHGADRSLQNQSGWTVWQYATNRLDTERSGYSSDPKKVARFKQIIALLGKPPAFSSASNPAASTEPNKPPLVSSAASAMSGWQQYSYAEDGFSIATPAKPEFQTVSHKGLVTHHYNIGLTGGRALVISVTDTRQGDKLEPIRALPAAKDGSVEIISEKAIKLAEYPGIEFEGRSNQWHVRSRIYAVKGTLFQLVSIGSANTPVAPETDRIFDSLTLIH